MAGQYLGAFLAALVLWGEYADVIKLAEATQVSRHCEIKVVVERDGEKNPTKKFLISVRQELVGLQWAYHWHLWILPFLLHRKGVLL